MQLGEPTPCRPARTVPPPVPPPSPGPRPPPEPLPIPVPLPFPRESVTFLASGSPKFAMLGLGTFKSGGPSKEGSIASLGFRFTIFACGGVDCVHLYFGRFPFYVRGRVWFLAPPAPPALSMPASRLRPHSENFQR